jgi:hypothetical protein
MKNLILLLITALILSCNTAKQKQSILKNDIKEKNMLNDDINIEIYKTIKILNEYYKEFNYNIFYSYEDVYKIFNNGDDESELISDSVRYRKINDALSNNDFTSKFSNSFISRINDFKNKQNDIGNLGYLITNHELGKTLLHLQSERKTLNLFFPNVYPDDPSSDMSDSCYHEYHINRIHCINDSIAVYKNRDFELCLRNEQDVIYFIFHKNYLSKWLLDDIQICPKDEEETFDLKLIGESKPLKYFEPYCENTDPNF